MSTDDPTPPPGTEGGDTLPVQPLGEVTAGGGPGRGEPGRWTPGALVAGRFRIERLLGQGGMGEVYLAVDTRLDRKLALKVLAPGLARDPQYLQRFHREARAASALSHPHVCVIHEIGEAEDGSPFMAMELIEGESLQARLRQGPLAIAEVIEIGIQVADALEAAHAKGIVHRDIKAANVLRSERGLVKVLDFGLAKRIAGAGDAAALDTSSMMSTQTGMLLGTPCYMSPEQALTRPVDHRSDLFSLGILLYELVTGRLPFQGTSIGEVTERIVHAHPEAMARFNYDLPSELDRIVRKCLEKSPDRRYQSARDLAIDLEGLRRDLERGEARPPQPASPAGAAARPPAPPETPALEDLKQSDVFLTYADVDDQPVVAGRQGWITHFQRNLKVRLEQLSGEPVRIWPQSNPLGRVAVKEEVLQGLPDVKTLVSVVSPPFVRSDGCRSQVATFWRTAETRGVLDVESRPRVLKVVKTPVESKEYPQDVAPFLERLKSFDFFEWDPETGRLREFDEAFGDLARQRYHERVYDVAHEIRHVLRNLRARAPASGVAQAGKVIFLAATTADLAAQRDQLQRELIEEGHRIVPQGPLPIIASEIETAVRGWLEGADIAIHLVGDRYGLVPEDTDLSIVAFQNRLAGEASAASSLQRLVWMPRGLKPRDERQEAFIRDLVRSPEVHRGAEVIQDTLENFKVLLRSRWSREAAAPAGDAAKGAAGPPRVYIICDPRDEAAVEPLEDFFYARGIEVSLPGFEAAEADAQDIHIRNLTDCDGALIFYGAGGSHWVDFNIRDLQKAAGYRGSVPIAARAVYIAPPASHRKERFRSVSADTIRQAGEAFDPAALEGFAADIKAARGAGR
jgi:serine/threonine protein kinase